MKKLVLSLTAICAAVSLNAQTPIANNGLESWTSGDADGFTVAPGIAPVPSSTNILATISGGTFGTMPLLQVSTGASEGTSFARLTTATLSGSLNANIPDGVYGSLIAQEIVTSDRPSQLTFDYMSAMGANDSSVVFIEATLWNGTGRTTIGQALGIYAGNQATWSSEALDMFYLDPANPDTITIFIASSVSEVFNTLGGQPVAAAVSGTRFDIDNMAFITPTPAPNVSNVVASDISNNTNGTDLQISFNVPADETDIAGYYAIAFESGDEIAMGLLADPNAFATGNGLAIAKTGSNQTAAFGAADVAYSLGTSSVLNSPIVENVPYKVVVYVEGQNGKIDVYAVSNEVTLTSSASIAEITLTSNVYPNPTADVLNINTNTEAASVSVISMDGKVIATQEMNGTSTAVNVAGLNAGAYFYEVKTADGSVVRNTFMKK